MSVRVKVCLNKIFKDHRKEAFVYVDPNLKQVSNFEKHIQKLFNIQSSIYLTIGGVLLPSQESVQVIHTGDVIIVNPLAEEINNGTEVSSIESGNELSHTIETIECHSNEESNPSKRGKRIRKRKRKQETGNDVEKQELSNATTNEPNLTVQPKKLLKETKKLLTELSLTNDVSVSSRKTSSHIRFSNDATETDVTTSSKSAPLNHLDVLQARVIRPVVVLTDAGSFTPTDNPVSSESVSDDIRECKQRIISLKEFANDSNFGQKAASIDFGAMIKNIEKSNEFATLKDEPKTYDIVGFKMLKIGKNYEPQLSEWIIAMVKDVEDLNITLHVLAGKDETTCPEGKLSMDICDDESESSELITLCRRDMLNVKVFLGN